MELLDKNNFWLGRYEKSRDFPGINIIRRNAQKLDTVLSAYDATIRHLLDQKKEYIYELTFLGQ